MQLELGVTIRPARMADAAGIGEVHVATWRSAYPGILGERMLSTMSPLFHTALYGGMIRRGDRLFVAVAPAGAGGAERVIGFTSAGRTRSADALAEGEIFTLYLLDDWRERGIGRSLLRRAAEALVAIGCRSAFLWVLSDNPSRWFYEHLGGRAAATGTAVVARRRVPQTAYVWDPIERLLEA
jgi:L-amino acid N-acyltransferase YncA